MTRSPWEEDTRPNLLRPSLQQRVAESVPPADDDSTVGMLMRQTVNNTTAMHRLTTEVGTLSREVRQSARAAPDTIHSTAKQASNRIALLMGTLFTLYETTAPYVREAWHQWRIHH